MALAVNPVGAEGAVVSATVFVLNVAISMVLALTVIASGFWVDVIIPVQPLNVEPLEGVAEREA